MTPKEKAKELYDFNWNWLFTSAEYSKAVLGNCCKVLALNLCNEILNEYGEFINNSDWKDSDAERYKFWNDVKAEIHNYTPFT